MTDDEIIALGIYCEDLLQNESFNTVHGQFTSQIVAHLLTTNPNEAAKREEIYASYVGVRDFIGHMTAIVAQKNRILEDSAAPSNELDALEQEDVDC